MSVKNWLAILALEILTIPFVIALFKMLPKKTAAVIAGVLFIGLGFGLLFFLVRKGQPLKTLTFWAGLVHLFAMSLPIFTVRLLHFEKDFTQIQVFGVPGPVYHYYSELFYTVLLAATIVDLLVCLVRNRSK